ncbi:MAG: redoxin domain-containing protein [Cytophagales bacterium]|nr:redoxin domain-containing protein [Cytophagales bacterium]
MKKTLVYVYLTVLVGFIGWLGYKGVSKFQTKREIEGSQNSLESIYGKLGVQGGEISRQTMIVYFNSECEHCQYEVQEIQNNLNRFREVTLAFVSHEPQEQAKAFLTRHQLQDYYLASSRDQVLSAFTGGVPQLLIYKDNDLTQHFKGEVKMEAILASLE